MRNGENTRRASGRIQRLVWPSVIIILFGCTIFVGSHAYSLKKEVAALSEDTTRMASALAEQKLAYKHQLEDLQKENDGLNAKLAQSERKEPVPYSERDIRKLPIGKLVGLVLVSGFALDQRQNEMKKDYAQQLYPLISRLQELYKKFASLKQDGGWKPKQSKQSFKKL